MLVFVLALMFAAPAAPPVPREVPLTIIAQGPLSDIMTARQVVVRDQQAWQALWHEHGVTKLPPTVDFHDAMIVGIFLGSHPSSGYRVEVKRAYEEGGRLVVEYVVHKPEPGAVTAPIITAPYVLVQVPGYAGPVQFVDTGARNAQKHH